MCRSADFERTLRTAQNELVNEPYLFGKLRMSIFWSILRIIKIIFLEKGMGILTLKGSQAAEQFVTAMSKAHTSSKRMDILVHERASNTC